VGRRKQRRPAVHLGDDKRYHAWITVGTRRVHLSGKEIEDVENDIDQVLDELASGHARKKGKPATVAEWMEEYLGSTEVRTRLGRRSAYDYRSKIRNWIAPHLGHIPLPDLETSDLDKMYAAMDAKRLAPSHLLKVHRILSRSLDIAVRRGKVRRNVAQLMDSPGSTRRTLKIEAFTAKEIAAIIAAVAGRPNRDRWLVALVCGTRQGETLGLRWEYLNLDTGQMDVSWQVQRLPWLHGCDDPHACGARLHRFAPCVVPAGEVCRTHRLRGGGPYTRGCPKPCPAGCVGHAVACKARHGGGLVFAKPKGNRGRIGVIPAELLVGLLVHRADQEAAKEAAGRWHDHDLVWCRDDGRPLDPRQDWAEWQAILLEAGLPPDRVHKLRHTAGSVLVEQGVDIRVVAEVLGHTDVRMTQAYTHVASKAVRAASEAIGAALLRSKPTVNER
jgi:integrase